jgi:CheY-like chemotaxis protein
MKQDFGILVINSDAGERHALIQALAAAGYNNVLEDDGAKASELVNHFDLGLIFLDADGATASRPAELLAELRSAEPLVTIPVIITASPDNERVEELLDSGANDYLLKPYNSSLIQTRLITILRLGELEEEVSDLLNVVIPIGVELSTEHDFDHLLEKILLEAKAICRADAGTLYLRTKHDMLQFVIVRNDSLEIQMGGTTGKPVNFPSLTLYDADTGEPNYHNVATYCALTGLTVNVDDAYDAEGFDFSGTIAFDSTTGYRSKSFLTLPLADDQHHVIGVLQLINALREKTSEPIPFDKSKQKIVELMARLATVALKAYIREEQLRRQIENLRIEIDETQRAWAVAQITETEYFQYLQEQTSKLRARDRSSKSNQ